MPYAARIARLVRALAALGLLAIATATPAQGPNPKLPVVELQAGMHVIRAELAADGRTRMIGLMFRETLGRNEGMLFVFPAKDVHCFWMKNTLIPLSIAFLGDDGRIVNIADMAPHAETSHCPKQAVRYALEMEQGWFAKRGIAAGHVLRSPQLFTTAKP